MSEINRENREELTEKLMFYILKYNGIDLTFKELANRLEEKDKELTGICGEPVDIIMHVGKVVMHKQYHEDFIKIRNNYIDLKVKLKELTDYIRNDIEIDMNLVETMKDLNLWMCDEKGL